MSGKNYPIPSGDAHATDHVVLIVLIVVVHVAVRQIHVPRVGRIPGFRSRGPVIAVDAKV